MTCMRALMAAPLMVIVAMALLIEGTESPGVTTPAGPPVTPVVDDEITLTSTTSPRVRRERRAIGLVNQRRANHGCPELSGRATLRDAARRHSRRMANHNTLSHRLPGEPALGERITRAGYLNWRRVGENIGMSSRHGGAWSPAEIVRAWMRSPSHRDLILDCRFRHIGVGLVQHNGRRWWTMNVAHR
jgi:uncharacterized protein YkwD